MKKNIVSKKIIVSVLSVFLLANCIYAQDAYEEEIKVESLNETENPKEKKKKSFIDGFAPVQSSYHFYDKVKLSTGTIGYGIKNREAEVFVDPETEKPGIRVYYQTSWFNFKFTADEIAMISEAYDKYLKDFENHELIKNNTMKTRKIYSSKGKCRVEWGTVKSMMNYFGDPYFHVGYEFKKNSPYFCIIVKDAKNLIKDAGSQIPERSVEVQLYFTKAEARDFLDKLGRERVRMELTPEVLDIRENDSYQ